MTASTTRPPSPSAADSDAGVDRVPVGAGVLLLLFFVSGATALVYEVVWVRRITLVFGATQPAISTVLAAFMGGLALGGWGIGRIAARVRSPLRAYAALEAGIGLYALVFPALMDALARGYRVFWNAFEPGPAGGVLFHLVSVLLLLLPPTAAMGGTLPLLAREATGGGRREGDRVGTLYAVNTAGAVVGVWAAGFVLLPVAGLKATLLLCAAANLGLAAVAWRLDRARPDVPGSEPGRTQAASSRPALAAPPDPAPRTRRLSGAAAAAFGVSGLCAMTFEVAWSRVLTLVLGNSVYAFSLMLIAFLSGIAAGAAVAARLVRRRAPDPALPLFLCLLGAGAAAWGTTWTFGQMPYWYVALYARLGDSEPLFYSAMLVLACAVMVPATLFTGAVMPFALAAREGAGGDVGRRVGTLYAWNTGGSIAGALGAGFLLVPRLGLQPTIQAAVALALSAAAAFGLLLTGRRRSIAVLLAGLALAATAAAFPRWDPLLMNAAMYKYVDDLADYSREAVRNHAQSDYEVVFYEEGPTSVVLVGRSRGSGNLWLANNGKVDASTTADMPTQVLLGHVPFHFAPRAERVLLVGLASGITAGSVLTEPVGRVDVLEIEPAVIEASRAFVAWNHRFWDDPRVTMVANDARNHLFLAEDPYDVIVNEPSNPWISGVSNLFTREFFELGRARLAADGVFCQWVQLYGLGPDDLRSLLRTFTAVFPHARIYSSVEAADLILVGSARPLRLDLDRVRGMVEAPRAAADLARIGVRGVADLLTYYLMDERDLGALTGRARLNTDDNMLIEFGAPKTLHYETQDANYQLLLAAASGPWRLVEDALAPLPASGRKGFFGELHRAYVERDRYGEAILADLKALALDPGDADLLRRIEELRAQVLSAAAPDAPRDGRGSEK